MKLLYDRSVTFPAGFKAGGVSADIKPNGMLDFGLIATENAANVAAVFTKNKFQAAPVVVSRKNLYASGFKAKAIVVNSGCANDLTGKTGIKLCEKTVAEVARSLGVSKNHILVASTGVLGRQLPIESMLRTVPALVSSLKAESDAVFSESIMTTDKFPKQVAVELQLSKGMSVRIGATAKGAGMIHPNMATMLCFATTDADIDKRKLNQALNKAVGTSFNAITIDGDTSTNDTVFLLANGASGNKIVGGIDYLRFVEALTAILKELATMIVRDGEGATRFVRLNIESAPTYDEAVRIGRTVAVSPLVKTAIFGGDPNWGRVISAVGNSGGNFDPAKLELRIGNKCVFKKNEPQQFDLAEIESLFSGKEIEMTIKLNSGRASAQVFTCDLSYDYVKINGEYTT